MKSSTALLTLFASLLAVSSLNAAINVTIGNFTSSSGGSFVNRTWTPISSPSRISVSELVTQLQSGNVTISTSGALAEEGDIEISSAIDINPLPAGSFRSLVLQARNDIRVNGSISDSNPATSQNLQLFLNAALTNVTGSVTLSASLAVGGSNITMNCNNFTKSPSVAITTLGGDIDLAASGSVNFGSGPVSTGGGNFRVSGGTSGLFNSTLTTYGGGIIVEMTESSNVEVASGALDASGGSGDGTVSINGFGGGISIASGVAIKSGIRGAISLSSGSATEDVIINGTMDAGSGGVSIRAQDTVQINAAINSIGAVVVRSDVDSNGAGNVVINAAITSSASRIDAAGVLISTNSAAILTTTNAGINGSLTLSGQEGLTLAGSLRAGGLVQLRSDSNSNGSGVFAITAPAISSVDGEMRIQGAGDIGSPIDTDAAGISFITNGNMTIRSSVTSRGGLISLTGADTGTVTLAATASLNSASTSGTGSVSLMKNSGSLVTVVGSSLLAGSLGSVEIRQSGSPGTLAMNSTITGGSLGVTLASDSDLIVDGLVNSSGPILLQANLDNANGGNLTINKAVAASNASVTLKGVNLLLSQTVSSSQKIIFEPSGEALVNAATNGNVELKSGITKPATNSLGNSGGITLLAPAILEFPTSAESLRPVSFTQNAGSELRMKLSSSNPTILNRLITGAIQFGGTLTISAEAGSTLAPPSSFDLFDFTSITGTHATIHFPPLGPTIGWNQSLLRTTGVLSLFYIPITSGGTPILVDFPTGGTLNQPVNSNGGNITIPGTGQPLIINSHVVSGGGQIAVTQTGPGGLTLGAGGTLNASGGNGRGSVSLTNQDGDVTTEPSSLIKSGTLGGVTLRAIGPMSDIFSGGRIEAGTLGASLIAGGNVNVTGEIVSTGPIYIEADKDGNGNGMVSIGAPITSAQNITIKGATISITHPVTATAPGKAIIDPAQLATITGIITGDVEVRGGLIKAGHGTLGNNGGITLISPAVLDFINPSDVLSPSYYTQAPGSELIIHIAGPNLGQYNRISSSGLMQLGGKLTIKLVGNYVPAVGAVFDIFDFTSISGDFASLSLPALRNGTMWDTRQLKIDGTLRVITSPPAENQQILVTKNASVMITLKAGGFTDLGFTVVSLPTSGLLSGTSPNLTYTPALDFVGEDRFTYRASSPTGNPTVATVVISVLPAISSFTRGTYYGIISGPDFAHSGSFTFTVTALNTVSGRIIYGDQSLAFTGKFDVNGQMVAIIKRTGGLPPITLILSKSTINGAVVVSGRIIDGDVMAILEGGGPNSNGGGSNGGLITVGRYTMNIFPNPEESGPAYPQGIGYMILSISKTGATSVSGRMPDGAFFTNSTFIQSDGSWPLHIRLYGGSGAFQAVARFLDGTVVRAVTSKWWKPAFKNWNTIKSLYPYSTALYPGGFNASPSLEGCRYVVPKLPLVLTPATPISEIRISLTGGNLPSDMSFPVIFTTNNRVIPLSNSPERMTASFFSASGLCVGRFVHPLTGRTVSMTGAINQRLGKFYGSFAGSAETGSWIIEPATP